MGSFPSIYVLSCDFLLFSCLAHLPIPRLFVRLSFLKCPYLEGFHVAVFLEVVAGIPEYN
jgi:hypothetical protein